MCLAVEGTGAVQAAMPAFRPLQYSALARVAYGWTSRCTGPGSASPHTCHLPTSSPCPTWASERSS